MSDPRDEALQNELKKNQDAIAGLQQAKAGIQAQIKILETHRAELKKATDGYPKAVADALQKECDDDNKIIKAKKTIAESVIKDLKDQIDDKINDFDKDLKAKDVASRTRPLLRRRRLPPRCGNADIANKSPHLCPP